MTDEIIKWRLHQIVRSAQRAATELDGVRYEGPIDTAAAIGWTRGELQTIMEQVEKLTDDMQGGKMENQIYCYYCHDIRGVIDRGRDATGYRETECDGCGRNAGDTRMVPIEDIGPAEIREIVSDLRGQRHG